ncbi:DUF6350 family protein [Cryobacterium sp. 10I1]|uniref:cell division protein PerM n=1 Tax=unclassified Cryobacterium TaxID=2649013 RepID=UPI002AC9E863|nr:MULTISPECIES: DUF6350 family protein [unclassified Cryobacterium]MEB0285663.1 DUF6350 family protein [Cryobacterium sp. 10S3]MEB0304588.1 DUF6350 family protein [Cryobacterium sp. 10I1]WPX12794.1 DUF6350 family protein [Cryobacterium sp. 10S3]
MNRLTTALLAALEALIVVAIGVGVSLVPLTILWATQYGLAVDWLVFWRASVTVWLLGNGVDLAVQLDPTVVAALGLPGAEAPFSLTIALLGFAVLALFLGRHTGRRAADSPHRWTGVLTAIPVYGLLATLLTLTVGTDALQPSIPQGVLLPTAVFAAGVFIGARHRTESPEHPVAGQAPHLQGASAHPASAHPAPGRPATGRPAWLRALPALPALPRSPRLPEVPAEWRSVLAGALRAGFGAATGTVGVAALAVFVLILGNFATIIGLYETVQAGVMGGITLTIAQLALIPNLVIWAAAWFVGPGIAVGIGSSVSPVGTVLGPVPGLPLLGVLPHGSLAFGFLGLLVPVLIGYLTAFATRQRQHRAGEPGADRGRLALTGALAGVVAGIVLGLLAWWSGGALGPGRLVDVGPNPLLVGAFAALEVGVAAVLGMLTPPIRRRGATSGATAPAAAPPARTGKR